MATAIPIVLQSNIYIPPNCIYPFEGELISTTLPIPFILEQCNFIGQQFGYAPIVNKPGNITLGCSIGGKSDPNMQNLCYVVLDGTTDTYNHELAHCNGWPASHPVWYKCVKEREKEKKQKRRK